MPSPPTNKEDVKSDLISAGIGDRYVGLKLSDFGELGARFLEVFAPGAKTVKPILRQGFLAFFTGIGAREFAYTLAAGLLTVFKAKTECLHLSDLSDALDNKDEVRINDLLDCDLLVVCEFLNTCAQPLSPRSAFRVESFLLERTETEGKSLILAGDGKIAHTDWWTARLTQRIQDAFIQETVATYASPRSAQVFKH